VGNLPISYTVVAIASDSCGRLHSSCLDTDNKIWTFTNWGRPFYLSSPILTDADYSPKQIECGWMFSSILTKSGDVFVWWPFDGLLGRFVQEKMREMDNQSDTMAHPDGTTIPCVPWGMNLPPTRLTPIPSDLPDLPNNGVQEEGLKPRLIQIAAFADHIVGLTNLGHVLKIASRNGHWEYVNLIPALLLMSHTEYGVSSQSLVNCVYWQRLLYSLCQTMKTHSNCRRFLE
jgi:SCF-associated factor 1